MKILIINSGSSSIKYQLINMPSEQLICKGMVDNLGLPDSKFQYKKGSFEIESTLEINSYEHGLSMIVDHLLDKEKGVIENIDEVEVIGHRVVHGGRSFSQPALINDSVKKAIKKYFKLAPLHNPANLEGIEATQKAFPAAKQVAVFDTAFHQTLPLKVKKYAIPDEFYEQNEIQVYGFHGTSHKYVSEKAIEFLQDPMAKVISIHLGNGCSITAVENGKSIDHSLGFAPANGLIMGTRSGDIDHSIIFHLVNELGYSVDAVNNMLIKESGLLALSGHSDMREIQDQIDKENKSSILALEMYAYRIKKYIGAYAAAMNGLDAIVFTAGVGENSRLVRQMVGENMSYLGIQIDANKNEKKSSEIRSIELPDSRVKVLVIPTNEELEIAKQAYEVVQ